MCRGFFKTCIQKSQKVHKNAGKGCVFLDFWDWISYNKGCYKKKDLDGDSKADQTLQRAGDGERPALVGQF